MKNEEEKIIETRKAEEMQKQRPGKMTNVTLIKP